MSPSRDSQGRRWGGLKALRGLRMSHKASDNRKWLSEARRRASEVYVLPVPQNRSKDASGSTIGGMGWPPPSRHDTHDTLPHRATPLCPWSPDRHLVHVIKCMFPAHLEGNKQKCNTDHVTEEGKGCLSSASIGLNLTPICTFKCWMHFPHTTPFFSTCGGIE